MNRIFILAFVLFATLFAVNAAPLELVKRETKFPPCPNAPPDVVGLDVKMTPDPFVPGKEETFDIKGTLKKDIVAGDLLGLGFIDLVAEAPIGDPLVVDICTLPGVTCPIKAGTAFSTTQQLTAPAASDLPKSYAIIIAMEHGTPPDVEALACSAAIFGADSDSSAVPDFWSFL
ncbi:uncharacterized protein OCT59_024128 [Rhizophagus irregularis]|uniref:Phosphatidylglycerol/phosphatidylinositol transfer protein n=2 Tax=Rhizophagus irregularis TaxID=588596 RepID=A0A015J8U9_RHIIW|nr:hypothetical protein GLOIN_2v1474253 [Rhizophagus irregularis DAOM 181602=DAOM 197198]EXX63310.1 hypothetical protein RirG_153450 [Rhizophagus irregularis DAOM 197198w]POG76973.1 hypothetical protein GLOIN_2v1474253 [Rhizophagus irregularis DAOM 181602=DAOM 197198]UZO03725.1 hypothetical protein OCT59_024128 [Rhizophagus irregularis]GBC22293.1 hypothetical protein GLOIN_2v1474253 [Rhizophagus irregularis DAOM 181602=DAOM 197198]|eukprot:XP_025183839.1 hypothetical protein GLOIN_2v1474253 [Rhizophagus irregularis DAOM 181602=DAOM 197198]